jgi:acetolactate synthase-1/2/3 large subunit
MLLAPQSGAMGYGLPAAIAASIAFPERQVVCFAGDGDLQMGLAELGTAVQHGAKLIILVLNNGAYGTIRMHQESKYPRRVSGTNLYNPDFAVVAQAFGMEGLCVRKTEEFEDAFEKACGSKTGAVLELIVSVEAITPRATISNLRSEA